MNSVPPRRTYTPSEVRRMWGQFWALVGPTLLIALWGAWVDSTILLLVAGIGLGTVWGNIQAACLHEMRHEIGSWRQEGLWADLLKPLQTYHIHHHVVAGEVEATLDRSEKDQRRLEESARMGLPTMMFLVFQNVVIVGPILLALNILLGWRAEMLTGGVITGTLFTICLTDDWGHVWHHKPSWQNGGLLGTAWNSVFSTMPCHGRHHEKGYEERGSYGNYPWCTPEAMMPWLARSLYRATCADECAMLTWLVLPVALIPIGSETTSWGEVCVALALPWAYIIAWRTNVRQRFVDFTVKHTVFHIFRTRKTTPNIT